MKQSIVFLFVAGLTCVRSVQRPSFSLLAKILVTNIQPEMVLANSPQFEAFNGAAVFVIPVAVVPVVAVATVAVADTYLS